MGESSYTEAQSSLLGFVKSAVLPPLWEVTLVRQFLPQRGPVVQAAGRDFVPQLLPGLFLQKE